MIGSQKQKPTEADGQSDWELPKVSPSPQGFPEELNDGTFRGKDGVQFEVRRRSRGR
ncbi:MAG: hypothetical protein ACRDT4_17315 [Micromonosporaceae bacterium]